MFRYSVSKSGKWLHTFVMIFLLILIFGLVAKIFADRTTTSSVIETEDIPVSIDGNAVSDAELASMFSSQSEFTTGSGTDSPVISAVLESPSGTSTTSSNPQVVVYHTHDCEAYAMTSSTMYDEVDVARTTDTNYSVVRVGYDLIYQLNLQFGVKGIQDTTSHEQPKLSTAYARSLDTASFYTQEYDDIVLLDIHRDAYTKSSWNPSYVVIDGEKVARILIVIGKGENYDEKPDYEKNLAYAEALTNALNEIHPEFARQVKVKDGRYNQHLTEKALLIEVGHHENTLPEALAATKYLAQAINKVFFSTP